MRFVQRLGISTAALLPVLFCGFANGATDDDPLPPTLTYQSDTMVYTVGTPGVPNVPTTACYSSFIVSPALPEGLSLDPDTGIIDGVPTAPAAKATYTVSAVDICSTSMDTDPTTTSWATLTITVNDQEAKAHGSAKGTAVYARRMPAAVNKSGSRRTRG